MIRDYYWKKMMQMLVLLLCLQLGQTLINEIHKKENLTSVPNNLGKDAHLIDLSFNNIASISPTDFSGFPALLSLDLGSNMLTQFPDLQAVAATLNILDLSNNSISNIDANLMNKLLNLL